jgi:hypothetical protein
VYVVVSIISILSHGIRVGLGLAPSWEGLRTLGMWIVTARVSEGCKLVKTMVNRGSAKKARALGCLNRSVIRAVESSEHMEARRKGRKK